MGVADDIAGDQRCLTVFDDGLHAAGCGFANGGIYFIARRFFAQSDGQIHNRAVRHRNTHGQSIQFAFQLRQYLADRDGCTGGCRDDIFTGRPAAAKILMRDIRQALVIGVGVHRGDVAFFNAKRLIQDFSDGGQTIGGAGSVGYNAMLRFEFIIVDTEHDGGVYFFLCGHR